MQKESQNSMDTTLNLEEFKRCRCARAYWDNPFGMCIRCLRMYTSHDPQGQNTLVNDNLMKNTWYERVREYLLAVDK